MRLADKIRLIKVDPGQVIGVAEWGYIDDKDSSKPLDDPNRFVPSFTVKNQITKLWGNITGKLLHNSPGSYNYAITLAYLEFSNDGAISPPTPGRDASREYYSTLNSSVATRDYLRVLVAPAGTANSNASEFEEDNVFYFAGQSEGTEGVHGLEYSNSAGSTVYGGALVAPRDLSNPSLDLIFSRLYSPTPQQLPKVANRQVAFRWGIIFG